VYQNNRSKRTKPKKIAAPKGIFVGAILLVLAIVAASGFFVLKNRGVGPAENSGGAQTESFDKTQYSLADPASPWLVVNKKRQLSPKDYEPAGLRTPNMAVESSIQQVNEQTAAALEAMAGAAAAEGINLVLISAYRSYDTQAEIYDSEVRGFGQAQADRESARPGHSEHQTGWAADLGAKTGKCEIKACFADTPEGKWLAANAYKYGFIIRYAEGKEHITGYMYEPWHVRYVGTELAAEMQNQGIKTLEEFFGLPAAPSY